MKCIIICNNCKKEFAIDDPEFNVRVNEIEDRIGEMISIMHRNGVNVSYKIHDNIFPILKSVMQCCGNPSIEFYMVRDDVWEKYVEDRYND